MATSTTANSPDAPVGSSPITSAGGKPLASWFQEIAKVFIASLSPNGSPVYDTGWVDLTLSTGYEAGPGATPQVRRVGKTIHIRGQILKSSGAFATATDIVVAVIPTGYRPARSWSDRYVPIWPNPTLPSPVAAGAYANGNIVVRVPDGNTLVTTIQLGPLGPYLVD